MKHAGIHSILKKYWGFEALRPLQQETLESVLAGRDSLTVMPTGGGKSLCYQLPAVMGEGTAIVISPTISLMKDQVDGLCAMGIQAAYWNSSLSTAETMQVAARLRRGELKLLYITPERLCMPEMTALLKAVNTAFFVIDEAHCISEWGHSFREDYRRLAMIKEAFPEKGVHAFTASATVDVQVDIVRQLGLREADRHIGHVDRPNLTYRMSPRGTLLRELEQILERHEDEPGIIYCPKRADVDKVSEYLNSRGIRNLPYHAGLSDETRSANQNRFSSEDVDIMVATLAFGMGIDRSNIRFIIHAAMPRNMEQYYQETGRAGRDGLPAACYLLFGAGDYRTGMFFIEQEKNQAVQKAKLDTLYGICLGPRCRHRVLSEYFGQVYDKENCGACDYCLGELELFEEPAVIAQKVLSAVARVSGSGFGFGAGHIVDILRGQMTEKVIKFQHDQMSVFNLLPDLSAAALRHVIEQLAGLGCLGRDSRYGTLSLTEKGRQVMKGEVHVVLAKPITLKKAKAKLKAAPAAAADLSEEDRALFNLLRAKRGEIARKRGKPAYIICGDRTLRDMAVKKPLTRHDFLDVYGIGEEKQKAFGPAFSLVIQDFLKG